MKYWTGCLLLLALLAPSGCSPEPPPPPQWNVVFIVIDTLRADHCSAFGYFRPTTPNLERLAARGVGFENAWSQAPWTGPSMVSLFTGRYVLSNYKTIPPGTRVLPERFQDGGYATAALVANPILYPETGFERGFDFYEVAEMEPREGTMDDSSLSADLFAEKAIALLKNDLKEPFFTWFHLFDPHLPYKPPERFMSVAAEPAPGLTLEAFRARQPKNPEQPITPQVMKRLIATLDRYDGEVAYADEAVGKIVDTLESMGTLERTLVVVTSDHGEGLYAHARYPGAQNAEKHGLYVGHGEHAYEEALHVPLIISGPGFEGAGPCAGLVELVDLYPTLLAAAGLPEDPEAHGVTLDRLMEKGKPAVFAFGTRDHALKTHNRMKLIYPTHPVQESGRTEKLHLLDNQHKAREPQLFLLSDDPEERKNLILQEPEKLKALKRSLEEWQNRYKNSLADTKETPDEMQRRLKGLGYAH